MEASHFTSFCKAAGVLPMTFHQNEALCLLGGELKRTGPGGSVLRTLWSDFGGGRETIDCDAQACASREFAEETLGLFGACGVDAAAVDLSAQLMAQQLRQGPGAMEVVHDLKVGKYHMFIAHTPYIDPLMFHLAAQQNASTMAVAGAEKTKFAWLPLAQLLRCVSQSRPRYHVHIPSRSSCKSTSCLLGGRPSRRLQLHPCFASSLRLAKEKGLDQLVASMGSAGVPRAPSSRVRQCSPKPPCLHTQLQHVTGAMPAEQEVGPSMLRYWLRLEGQLWQPPGPVDQVTRTC